MSIALRLPSELEARFEKICHLEDRSKSYFARVAIERLVQDYEDARDAQRVMKSNRKSYTLSELEAELGLGTINKRKSKKTARKSR